MAAETDLPIEQLNDLIIAIDELNASDFEETKLSLTHFERIIVLNGAALALSFSAATTIRGLHPQSVLLAHRFTLLSAWLFLIVSVVFALYHNFIAIKVQSLHSTIFGGQRVHMRQLLFSSRANQGKERGSRVPLLKPLSDEDAKVINAQVMTLKPVLSFCSNWAQILCVVGLIALAVFVGLSV